MHILHPISRRSVLRGAGVALTLPLLESFLPATARAATAKKPPVRLIFLSYGWGVSRREWFPKDAGRDYTLSECLQPLARHKADFSVLSNLSNKEATQGHWGCTTWLTSANVNATPGKQFQNTVSVDQVAARKLGIETRFPSLELSSAAKEEGYGPGLSLAWSETGNSLAGENNPVALFNRLFGADEVPLAQRKYLIEHEQSILDAVMSDAQSLQGKLSRADRGKVDEYFQSVREIEVRLKKADDWLERPRPEAPLDRPGEKLTATEEVRVMYDLLVAALQTDMTRVITYRQPVNGLIKDTGFKVVGHSLTHYSDNTDAHRASIARDKLQAEMLAELIDKLKELRDPDGSTMFDNTLIAYGSGIRTNHDLRDTPTLLAGHGGGGVNQGAHYVYKSNDTPLANLWLSMLRQVGIEQPSFADSTGRLPDLFA